jgi:hypothetical protein
MTGARRLILTALVLALALPAAAQARTDSPGPTYRVETRSANGYHVVVIANTATLTLEVVRNEQAKHSGAATNYFARATTKGGTINSRIGGLGEVHLTFHPSGNERVQRRNCFSPLTRHRLGTFTGSFRFTGEGDYVKIDAHRLHGAEHLLGPRCNSPFAGSHPDAKRKTVHLFAGFRSGLDATYFDAWTLSSGGSFYEADSETGGSEYAVQRFAYAYAPASTFATDDSLSFAELTPPYPFSGTGSIERAADGAPAWTGSLAVSYPGAEDVPLTGPPFKARLTREW